MSTTRVQAEALATFVRLLRPDWDHPGIVHAIGEVTAPHPSGLPFRAITIDSDGLDRWADAEPLADPFAAAPEEISQRAARAGVVGLGGATFPSAVKFALGKRLAVTTLIVNGGECEPYLSSDDRIMRDFADQVVDGAVHLPRLDELERLELAPQLEVQEAQQAEHERG